MQHVPCRPGRWWTDAAATVGLVSAVLLTARYARPPVTDAAWSLRFPESSSAPNAFAGTGPRIVIWALVVIAAVAGWRLIAVIGGWGGVLAEVAAASANEPSGLAKSPEEVSAVILVLIAATAVSMPAPRRRAVTLLGRRGMVLIAVAGLAGVGGSAVEPLLWTQQGEDVTVDDRLLNLLAAGTYAVVIGLLVAAIARIDPVIRRRTVVLAAVIAAFLASIRVMSGPGRLGGFSGSLLDIGSPAWWLLPPAASAVCLATGVVLLLAREGPAG
ncbi:hypothetical protein EDC02_4402 [Micromonospora sp. Llam0]|uniref:hypothetical protein n=1 Tax=Micromonospora sp. Llam0 TaxID=2485143 RepID=UPI000F477BA3|nr:hypothetical protein [Micromonospora sp. Llam0]ROO62423.1 hypothetical protein EDC02_4402 [Micromonospora sp. Llam0]